MNPLGFALNVLDMLIGVLVLVRGFMILVVLNSFPAFIISVFAIICGATMLMLELVEIPFMRSWLTFYYMCLGRALFIIFIGSYFGGIFGYPLALFIIAMVTGVLWIVVQYPRPFLADIKPIQGNL